MPFRTLAVLAAAVALATPALAEPCVGAGEKSAKAVKLDPKDTLAYVTWAYSLDAVLNPPVMALAKPQVTCTRGEFQALGETYVLTGENTELFPRRAVPASPGKPALYLAPVRDLTKAVSAGLGVPMKYQAGATYGLVRIDGKIATAVRVYKKIPTDDVLMRDLAEVLATGGQPFARMELPDGKTAIVVGRAPASPQ